MGLPPKPKLPPTLSGDLNAFLNAQQRILDQLSVEDERATDAINAIIKSGQSKTKKEELQKNLNARIFIADMEILYNISIANALNNSAQVKALQTSIEAANKKLDAGMKKVNDTIQVVKNVNAILKTADAMLKAVVAIAALV